MAGSPKLTSLTIIAASALMAANSVSGVSAFQMQPNHSEGVRSIVQKKTTQVVRAVDEEYGGYSVDNNSGEDSSSRRTFLNRGISGAMAALIGSSVVSESAEASYTAYTQREDDWSRRKESGDIQYSNARDLKSQLREIAPMNSEGSKIFCPNGESSAVTPLMENRCGDRLALPSVYGRSDDGLGNSIPGFGSSAVSLRGQLADTAYFSQSQRN